MPTRQFFACSALLSSLLAATAGYAQDPAEPRIMLVLDGSSSMWARLEDDVSKIEVARGTIAELVGEWEAKMAFGITTYGHREEANCEDIETVLPIAEVDADQVIDVVENIMPRGKTPLTAALRQAADALDYENRPAKILLVSDGIENCGQDPCKAAAELAAKAKDLSIDVIGFDMNNHQMGRLECISSNANGHLIRADLSSFTEAMDHSMSAIIEDEAPTASLSLKIKDGDTLLSDDVRYVVYLDEDDDFSPTVAQSFIASPTLNLPSGRYLVEAIHGEGVNLVSQMVEIALDTDEEAQHIFQLAELNPPTRTAR